MVYVGHFSFESHGSPASGSPTAYHGFFTCVAEALSVETALVKFETLLRRIHNTDDIFRGVDMIHLDSCIEIKLIPSTGFLAYFCEVRGKIQGAIWTSLIGVGAKHAAGYHFQSTGVDDEDVFESEPFLVFEHE